MDVELRLATETVSRVTDTEPLMIGPEVPLRTVLRLMRAYLAGCVLVVRKSTAVDCGEPVPFDDSRPADRLLGVFTERDALCLMARGIDGDSPIGNWIRSEPVTIGGQASLAAAILKMSSAGVRRLPVIDETTQAISVVEAPALMHRLAELIATRGAAHSSIPTAPSL